MSALQQLESHFLLTCDIGRPYEPLGLSNSYVVEQLVRHHEVFSVMLFNKDVTGIDALPPLAKKAWGHLRRGIRHFHRLRDYLDGSPEAMRRWERERAAAQAELLEFAKLMEAKLPEMCKLNLHLMLCWLASHEKDCGHILYRNEMWLERMIQLLKPRTRRVFAKDAAVSIAKAMAMGGEVARLQGRVAGAMTVDDLRQVGRIAEGDVDRPGRFMLLHKGTRVGSKEWEQILAGLAQLEAAEQVSLPAGYLDAPETRAAARVHRAAFINGNEHILAHAITKERTRMSFFVRVKWEEVEEVSDSDSDGEPAAKRQRVVDTPYVGAVRYFVRLPPREEGEEWLRLAMCDYYTYDKKDKRTTPLKDRDTGDVLCALHYKGDPEKTFGGGRAYPTPLECIDTKLVGFWRADAAIAPNCMRMYFTENESTSGHTS